MYKKLIFASIFVLLFGLPALAQTSVNELEGQSAFIMSDNPAFNQNGATNGAFCTANVVTGGVRPVMVKWPLWTLIDQEVVSEVNIVWQAPHGSEGNVKFRIVLNPKPWVDTTVTYGNYVGSADWRTVWDINAVKGFLNKTPATPPASGAWGPPPADANLYWFYAKDANKIPRSVVQNWLYNPGSNHGIAIIHRAGFPMNACLMARSGEWWGQGLAAHIQFDVQFVPNRAKTAQPLSGSQDVTPCNLVLSWMAGADAVSHDVYFGTDFNDVNNAADPNTLPGKGRQLSNIYPESGDLDLDYSKTYYWRVDEVNTAWGKTRGNIWSFTTTNGKATLPSPYNGQANVATPLLLSWARSVIEASGHDVYLGTSQADVTNATVGNPLGVYKGHVTDPNYSVASLTPAVTYYWRIDEANNVNPCGTSLFKGDVWSFSSLGSGKALNPSPADTSAIPDITTVILSWRKGDWVRATGGHDVFFGTDATEVNNATRTVYPNVTYANRDVNNYDPKPLEFSRTYYWRVDEINDIADANKVWKGDVWSFSTLGYISVDNFDAYTSDVGLWVNWDANDWPACSSETGTGGRNYDDADDMRFTYDNNGTDASNDYYSEIRRDFGPSGVNWTTGSATQQVKAFALSFRGQAANQAHATYDRMFVCVTDTNNHQYTVNHSDPNAQKNGNWVEWNIDLTQFSSHGVDLRYVRYLSLGFGKQCNYTSTLGGEGTVWFDDIRLYPRRCLTSESPAADLTADCTVNLDDLDIVAGDWLNTDANIILSPIQKPADPCLWYKFDDGTGLVADDSARGYDGIVKLNQGWSATGGYDANGYLYLDGVGQNVSIPANAFSDNITENMTIALWVKVNSNEFPQIYSWAPMLNAQDAGVIFQMWCPTPAPPTFAPGPAVHFRFPGPNGDELSECYPPNVSVGSFTGRWHHYAFVKDGTNNKIAIYHNGLPLCDPNATANVIGQIGVTSAMVTSLGSFHPNVGGWAGAVDDFRVYNYALSAAEIAYIATNGTGSWFLPLSSPANLYTAPPNIVNFKDLAILANSWMVQQYWP